MKKITFLLIFMLSCEILFTQQLPYYTQYRSNPLVFNPAVTGTKRMLDVRMNYRKQWVGFDGQPTTKGISVNSRLFKGMMGLGMIYYVDETGPTRRDMYQGTYAFHLRKPDFEISMGLGVHMMKYTIDGFLISIMDQSDNAIMLSYLAQSKNFDANAGFYVYNDRFHFGLAFLDLLQMPIKFYPGSEEQKANIYFAPHTFASIGYNWAEHPDYVWENSLMANYVKGSPLQVDYNLRLHIREEFFVGLGIRRKDAIAAQFGINLLNEIQLSYSYDYGISKLRSAHSNSHEIHLIWSTNLPYVFGNNRHSDFQKRKYGYYF